MRVSSRYPRKRAVVGWLTRLVNSEQRTLLEAVTPAVTANSVLFEPHKTSVSNGVSTESVVLALVRKEAVRTESAVSAALVSGEVSAQTSRPSRTRQSELFSAGADLHTLWNR